MSECVEMFRDIKDMRRREREVFGVGCPECKRLLPKANAKILLPGQLCRAHKPYYRDKREPIVGAEWTARMNGEEADYQGGNDD